WESTRTYQEGDWATYGGYAWRALYYTRGQVPGSAGSSGAWEHMGPCDGTPWDGTGCAALQWQTSRIYNAGDQVTWAGKAWQANYYTRGNTPGTGGQWTQIADCDEAFLAWGHNEPLKGEQDHDGYAIPRAGHV